MADVTGMQPSGRVLPLYKGDYDNDTVYEQTDVVLYNVSSYIALQDTIGNPPPKNGETRNEHWQLIAKGMADVSGSTVEFTQAETRSNIASGETGATLFGKIKKWFADLKPHCFNALTNNLLANIPGVSAMDAAVGPGIDSRIASNADAIAQLNSDLSGAKGIRLVTQYINELSTDENGLVYYDYVSTVDLPQYSSPIAQNSFYNNNQVLGTRNIAKNTIRIYFSRNGAPLTVSILFHV